MAAHIWGQGLGHHWVQARLRDVEQERGELLSQLHLLEERLEASKLQVRSSGVLWGCVAAGVWTL